MDDKLHQMLTDPREHWRYDPRPRSDKVLPAEESEPESATIEFVHRDFGKPGIFDLDPESKTKSGPPTSNHSLCRRCKRYKLTDKMAASGIICLECVEEESVAFDSRCEKAVGAVECSGCGRDALAGLCELGQCPRCCRCPKPDPSPDVCNRCGHLKIEGERVRGLGVCPECHGVRRGLGLGQGEDGFEGFWCNVCGGWKHEEVSPGVCANCEQPDYVVGHEMDDYVDELLPRPCYVVDSECDVPFLGESNVTDFVCIRCERDFVEDSEVYQRVGGGYGEIYCQPCTLHSPVTEPPEPKPKPKPEPKPDIPGVPKPKSESKGESLTFGEKLLAAFAILWFGGWALMILFVVGKGIAKAMHAIIEPDTGVWVQRIESMQERSQLEGVYWHEFHAAEREARETNHVRVEMTQTMRPDDTVTLIGIYESRGYAAQWQASGNHPLVFVKTPVCECDNCQEVQNNDE